MNTVYIADTGIFVRCGGQNNKKFQQLRNALRKADTTRIIPQRVYEELGGDPVAEAYPSASIPVSRGFKEGWVTVADELDYTNSVVSAVMDKTRRFIATKTERNEDVIEKTDTALVGLAAQLLDTGQAARIVLLTTDKPAGEAAQALLPQHGFEDQIEYQYVSVEYLETVTADAFC